MDSTMEIPDFPIFSEEEIQESLIGNQYRSILFEFYKWLCTFISILASIKYDKNNMKELDSRSYAVFIGSLARITKLMHSNITLISS